MQKFQIMAIRVLTFLELCLFIVPGFAQGVFETAVTAAGNKDNAKSPVFYGYVRGSAWGGSRQNDFQVVFSEMALKTKVSADKLFLGGDVRFREGIFFGERISSIEFKEAYAGYHGNKINFSLGNQIIKWGRTDGFNPTDNISPNDYFFLSPEPDDQKLSNFMVRARTRLSASSELEIIGIPVYRPSVYRYDLFDLGHGAGFSGLLLPPKTIKNGTMAARLNVEMSAAGLSVSWFHGFDPFYGFSIDSVSLYPATMIQYRPSVYKKDAVGADFAIPLKTSIIRGELALNLTKGYKKEMYIPNPDLSYVLGIEHDFGGFNTIFQYIGKSVANFSTRFYPVLSDPANPLAQLAYAKDVIYYESRLFNRKIFNQQKKGNHALFVTVSRRFAHDLVNINLSGYYNITSEEYMVRPLLKWDISDALSATAGFSFMKGPDQSVFVKAGKVLNGIFLGLSASF